MTENYPKIDLLRDHRRRVTAGHPWAFSNEVAMTAEAKALPPGGLVRLATASGEIVGIAGFNPHSLIAVRLIDRKPKTRVDTDYLAAKLRYCLASRDRLFDAPYYRLVHAEADGLPGLVVDRFGDALSVQLNSAMMDRLRAPLLAALEAVLAPRIVVLRNDSASRKLEGLEQGVEVVTGDAARPVELTEGGARFLADLAGGQKTGWYFDQRDNRCFVASLARDARVLDVYSHTGGFAIQAALAGAREVIAVDSSALALALAEQSAQLNGCGGKSRFVKADAFNEMERLSKQGERFELVIADPPSFIKSKKDLAAGIKGYRKMMRLAARLVAPGGHLFVASCSHNMTAELFDEQLRKTLSDANRGALCCRRMEIILTAMDLVA